MAKRELKIEWFPGLWLHNYQDKGFYVMDQLGSIHRDPFDNEEDAQLLLVAEQFIDDMEEEVHP